MNYESLMVIKIGKRGTVKDYLWPYNYCVIRSNCKILSGELFD